MRTKLVLVVLTASAAAAFLSSSSAGASGALAAKCGGGSETFLFWPSGHGQITSVNFGAYPLPHLEAYKTGTGFPNGNFRAFLDSNGQSSTAKSCKTSAPKTVGATIKNSRSAATATQLVCKFKKNGTLYMLNAAGAHDFRVIEGSKLVVNAHFAAQGSKMTWDGSKCKPQAPPS